MLDHRNLLAHTAYNPVVFEQAAVRLPTAGGDPMSRAPLGASELEELPLPYRFDVHALAAITHTPLLEPIARVGMVIYPEPKPHPAELP